eukprot:12067081-Alexandrium_andersonii.AAC.1
MPSLLEINGELTVASTLRDGANGWPTKGPPRARARSPELGADRGEPAGLADAVLLRSPLASVPAGARHARLMQLPTRDLRNPAKPRG